MKSFRKAALAVATLALAAGPAFAFPDRPVQLIVPWAAGGVLLWSAALMALGRLWGG